MGKLGMQRECKAEVCNHSEQILNMTGNIDCITPHLKEYHIYV